MKDVVYAVLLKMSGGVEDVKPRHIAQLHARNLIVRTMSPGVLSSANFKHTKDKNCMAKDRYGSARLIGRQRSGS